MERLAGRVSFLQEAAFLLSISSPAASATLGAARDRLLEAEETDRTSLSNKDWEAIRRETCGACGNLMVPGWSCRIAQEPRQRDSPKSQKVPSNEANQHVQKDIVYACLRCSRETVQPLPYKFASRPLKKEKRKSFTTDSAFPQNQPSGGDAAKMTISGNASSKQRAKARKGGLQALLSQSKTAASGKGLDLMDFMQ